MNLFEAKNNILMDRGAREILICQREESAEMLWVKVPSGPPKTVGQIALSLTKQTEERENKKSLFWCKKDNEKGKSKFSILPSFLNL